MMKQRINYVFLFVGIVAGLLIVWQFLTRIPIVGRYPVDELSAHEALINEFTEDQAYLQSQVSTLRSKVDEAQKNISQQSENYSLELLDSLKKRIGLTEVTGSGVSVNIDDSFYSDKGVVQAADIRDISNLLFSDGANAVSVNNHRAIASSPISSVGSRISINNFLISSPYFINAVGDPETMIRGLSDKSLLFSIYEKSLNSRMLFVFSEEDFLVIPGYSGEIKTNFLNLIDQ